MNKMTNSHIAYHMGTTQGNVESPCHTNCITESPKKSEFTKPVITIWKLYKSTDVFQCSLFLWECFVPLWQSVVLSDLTVSVLAYREHSMQSIWATGSSDFDQMLVVFLGFDHSKDDKRLCHDQMSVFLLGTSFCRKWQTERFHSHH